MIEKLLENWLDKASERSYQPVFVQMLAAEGYKVLHSTRHCLLEFGSDVLAIAPDGVGCAFQLKGDPSGRMKTSDFRAIQPQIVQLMSQAPGYPGFPSGAHRSYLVSNGQFEEEVQVAVQALNRAPYPSKLELWSRGTLLAISLKSAEKLWPGELSDSRTLLDLYSANPRGKPPIGSVDAMLGSLLGLDLGSSLMGKQELVRAASSAAWLCGVAVAGFAEQENHYSVALTWAQCSAALIGAAERHAGGDIALVSSSLDLAKAAALDALSALWEEVRARTHLGQGDPLTDRDVMSWRISVLFGLLTCLAIADYRTPILREDSREDLNKWLTRSKYALNVWGEAAVGYLFPWLVLVRMRDATNRPDQEFVAFAETVISSNQSESPRPLMSPYYDGEEVLFRQFGLKKVAFDQPETFAGRTHVAEVAMHLLVRANMKQKCKALWPDFTRLNHHRLELKAKWEYCRLRAHDAVEETKIYPSTYPWADLKSDALSGSGGNPVPNTLGAEPWLLALWWQAAPHRLSADSARVFTEALIPGWGS